MDLESESNLVSLLTYLVYEGSKDLPLVIQIISVVSSLDLDSQPKPETEFMSLITQIRTLYKHMDLTSQPKQLSDLISGFTQLVNPTNSDEEDLISRIDQVLDLEPEPELVSLIYQLLSLIEYMVMKSNYGNPISLRPQVRVSLGEENILHIDEEREPLIPTKYNKWECFNINEKALVWSPKGEGPPFYVVCRVCRSQHHERYETVPVEINKHPLHSKHSLQLVNCQDDLYNRKCYCCDEILHDFIYCCLTCDFSMNIACMEKPIVLSREEPKWHEHTLSLFPRKAPLTCNLCGLGDSSCPFYICPPCDFSAHQSCLKLPHVIRISRHLHRISFKHSFNTQESLICRVCRKHIDNDYGGYSCVKSGCSYAAHSLCATQSNVWDGEELEGVPEEIEEELEPFERISDGIIRHFSHRKHNLRLDESTGKSYDENKQCQACITPFYSGNFYSCMECDFILHEECANLSRKIYHPTHPHMLALKCDDVQDHEPCSACYEVCTTGFFYECVKEECEFKVHVQCGVISEPSDHGSHIHPLFLTSKPGEERKCSVCNHPGFWPMRETFNCIECDFSLCFRCSTIPQKVRYKYDDHMFTLFYGKETSTTTSWCEVCEKKIDPKERFYTCDGDCCVTLHVGCVIGDLYMKLGSLFYYKPGRKMEVMPNNLHMSRPFCSYCEKRCTQKIVFKVSEFIFCSMQCSFGHGFNTLM